MQTDRRTDTLIAIPRFPFRGGVMGRKKLGFAEVASHAAYWDPRPIIVRILVLYGSRWVVD